MKLLERQTGCPEILVTTSCARTPTSRVGKQTYRIRIPTDTLGEIRTKNDCDRRLQKHTLVDFVDVRYTTCRNPS